MKFYVVVKNAFEIQNQPHTNSKADSRLVSRKLRLKMDEISKGVRKGVLLAKEFEMLKECDKLLVYEASDCKHMPDSTLSWKDLENTVDPNLDVEVGFYAYNEFVETKKDFIKFEDCEIQQWLKNLESKIRNVGLELRLKFKIENFKYKSIKAGPLAIVTEDVALTEVDSQSEGVPLYSSGNWDREKTWNHTFGNYNGELTITCVISPTENCVPVVERKLYQEVQNTYRDILSDEIHTDAVIVSKEETIVKCHKAVITAQSSVLATMFSGSFKESKTNQIEMPDMSECGIKALLAYLYYRDVEIYAGNSVTCVELYQAAHKYDIPILEKRMRNLLYSKPSDWFDVETVVRLFLFTRNLDSEEDLKNKAVKLIRLKYDQLKDSPSYKDLFQKNPEAAMELCEYAFKTSF